ncbi:hypothetical protein H1R20_g691, partial [Candolleomyces eurysporus]
MPSLTLRPFLSVPSKSPTFPKVSKRRWPLDGRDDPAPGVNTFKPYQDVPEEIIRNVKNPWRPSFANSTSTSWAYHESSDPVLETRAEPYKAYTEQVIQKPSWYIHFHVAVRSTQPEDHESRAKKIVKSAEDWCLGDLSLLVHLFIARAAICEDEEPVLAVGSFAQQVCYYFENNNPSYYTKFVNQLGRVLIGTFLACWDRDCERSLARLPYTEHQTENYLSSSLNLAKFMGALVGYGVLTPADIKPCVRLLVHQATHTEYLMAIRELLTYAEDRFWKKGSYDRENDVSEFLQRLSEVVSSSSAEEIQVQSDVDVQLQDEGDDGTITSPPCMEPGVAVYDEILELVDHFSRAAADK